MLIKHQGNRFVFLQVIKFRIRFVGNIGSVYPTFLPNIPLPVSEHTIFTVFLLMNSRHLGGGKGKFSSHGLLIEAFLNTRKDIDMPCDLSDRTTHKTSQIIENSV